MKKLSKIERKQLIIALEEKAASEARCKELEAFLNATVGGLYKCK